MLWNYVAKCWNTELLHVLKLEKTEFIDLKRGTQNYYIILAGFSTR